MVSVEVSMRKWYLLESYRHKLLSRLYSLRQGNRSVMAYYDEFQKSGGSLIIMENKLVMTSLSSSMG